MPHHFLGALQNSSRSPRQMALRSLQTMEQFFNSTPKQQQLLCFLRRNNFEILNGFAVAYLPKMSIYSVR